MIVIGQSRYHRRMKLSTIGGYEFWQFSSSSSFLIQITGIFQNIQTLGFFIYKTAGIFLLPIVLLVFFSIDINLFDVFLGSYEQSPRLLEMHRCHRRDSDSSTGDLQLREDLADAMQESPAPAREQGMFKKLSSLFSRNMYIIMYNWLKDHLSDQKIDRNF